MLQTTYRNQPALLLNYVKTKTQTAGKVRREDPQNKQIFPVSRQQLSVMMRVFIKAYVSLIIC
jgi:hypothetical protein